MADETQPQTQATEVVKEAKTSVEDILAALTKTIVDSNKGVAEALTKIGDKLDKALETPTNLAIKPKDSDNEDIGAQVSVPNTYQSNSVQAGIRDDGKGSKTDGSGLAMQEKAQPATEVAKAQENQFSQTETPRPGASAPVEVRSGKVPSPILKACREQGFEGLSIVAKEILSGKFYKPSAEEVQESIW